MFGPGPDPPASQVSIFPSIPLTLPALRTLEADTNPIGHPKLKRRIHFLTVVQYVSKTDGDNVLKLLVGDSLRHDGSSVMDNLEFTIITGLELLRSIISLFLLKQKKKKVGEF